MEQAFILVLVGFTSVGAYVVSTKSRGQSGSGLRHAVNKMLECVGMTLVFLVINLAVGVTVILTTRVLMRRFVALYLAADSTLLVLSFLQGLTFQWWRAHSAPSSGNP